MSLILASGKREIELDPPWANASGFLPAQSPSGWFGESPRMGAWITPATSLAPRTPARGPRVVSYPGGVLLHTGHPNPGLSVRLSRDRPIWRAIGRPIIVHLIVGDAREMARIAARLESIDEVGAVELNMGETADSDIPGWLGAAATAQIPIIAQFPIGTPTARVRLAADAGAAAISAGPPRGVLPGPNGEAVAGRLYGPSLLPLGLRTVEAWTEGISVPVLGGGGVTTPRAVQAMFRAGAAGVILDTILWTEPEVLLEA